MNQRRPSRAGRQIKTKSETEAYKRRIKTEGPAYIDEKTAPAPIDPEKTNESSFEQREPHGKLPVTKKSPQTRIRDFINGNLAASILGGLLVAAIVAVTSVFVSLFVAQGIQDNSIEELEKDVDEAQTDIKNNQTELTELKTDFSFFKEGTKSGITDIKQNIDLLKDSGSSKQPPR